MKIQKTVDRRYAYSLQRAFCTDATDTSFTCSPIKTSYLPGNTTKWKIIKALLRASFEIYLIPQRSSHVGFSVSMTAFILLTSTSYLSLHSLRSSSSTTLSFSARIARFTIHFTKAASFLSGVFRKSLFFKDFVILFKVGTSMSEVFLYS
jgi:hypothetical protein